MRAIDTNVVVRLIVRDAPKQVSVAEAFVSKGAWISQIVLAETVWVLGSAYKLSAMQIVSGVEMLLNNELVALQDADVVEAALYSYRARPAVSFADHLIVETARKHGRLPVGTFDRAMSAIDGTERLR